MLDLVLRSRSDLVGEVRSEGYLAPGADHHMLEFELCGPARSLGSEEMVPDWSKADMALLKERFPSLTALPTTPAVALVLIIVTARDVAEVIKIWVAALALF